MAETETETETGKLLKARVHDMVIVCRYAPHKNQEVTYSPRRPRDPQPWLIREIRYSGGECEAMSREDYQTWADAEDTCW